MPKDTEQRRLALEQATASTRIEGHVPTAEFLQDADQVAQGNLSSEQAINRALKRAHAFDRRARESDA